VIERLMDGVWLVLGFWVVGRFVELPRLLEEGSKVLIAVLLVAAALLAWAVFYRRHAHEIVQSSRWSLILRHVVDGVYLMGRSSSFAASAFLSLVYLALQVMPVWCLMQGYGLHLSLGAAATVLVVLRLGTVIPQAPGNVGSFQLLTIAGVGLFGIEREVATGFATLLFIVVTVPLYLGGFVALIATRMRLGDIHRSAHEAVSSQQEKHP
jgi:uncharacterized membrane protein YbhN (UPF0104 family)